LRATLRVQHVERELCLLIVGRRKRAVWKNLGEKQRKRRQRG
jgi:hypothetical protein